MSSNATLPVSDVVAITVQGTPVNLQMLNINTCALISSEVPSWSATANYMIYQSATQVGVDFGTSSKAFAIATAFFAQNPNPLSTQGSLVIIPVNTGTPATLALQSITYTAKATGTGGNSITIAYVIGATPGQEVVTVVGNAITVQIATTVSTANQVLAAINASAAASLLVTAYLNAAGTTAQTAVAATNLASGAATGTEPIMNAIIRMQNTIYFYGILIDVDLTASSAVALALAAYIQTQQKMLFYPSATVADITTTTGLMFKIVAAGNSRTRCIYYSDGTLNDTLAMVAAYASRLLSVNFAAPNSVITMNLKQLATVVPDQTVTETVRQNALANGIDVYPAVGSPTNGVLMTSGQNQFTDQVYAQDWFSLQVQTNIFNFLAGVNSKIPQTEPGMTSLKNVCAQACQQAVLNGWVAPGSWTSATSFGNPQDFVRNIGEVGYYIYSQPVVNQSQSLRQARQAPPIQIALKMAGAIHFVTVNVFVNL